MMGHGRLYVCAFEAVAVTAQQDVFYIKPAADKPVFIESFALSVNGGAADAGDAQEELYDLQLCYVPATVTASSGGSSLTPQPVNINDTAASFTARANDTTKATTTGSITTRGVPPFNSRIGSEKLWAPEHRPLIASAAAWTLRLNTTPADSISLSGELYVRELP
jgi:hypothetical protein